MSEKYANLRIIHSYKLACYLEIIKAFENLYTFFFRCGNVAAILELDEQLNKEFTIFEAAPQESRGAPSKKPQPDYFL
jgi:serine/threonine-protein phosphatase 4 catalytic subunit